jgi:hypothetical protein
VRHDHPVTSGGDVPDVRVLRAPGGLAATVLVAVVTAAAAISAPPEASALEVVRRSVLAVVPVVLLTLPVTLPRLHLGTGGAVVDGVLRRWRVPWDRVSQVRQGWFLTLDLDDGRSVRALAAPVVTSMVAFRQWSVGDDDLFLRDSARRPSYPGATRPLLVELVESYRAARRGEPPTPSEVRVRWQTPVLVVLAVLVLLWLVALVTWPR